jgi:hypothetical protein
LRSRRDNSVVCDICVDVIGLIERLLADQVVEEDIAALLDQYCEGWPAPIPVICTSVVDQYLPIVLQLLAAGVEKSDICSRIGLCSSAARRGRPARSDIFCDFCQSAVEAVKELLNEQATRDEIREFIMNLCEDLPSAYASLCIAFVNAYTDTVIDMIEADADPLEVCQVVGLCISGARRQARAVRGSACGVCNGLAMALERDPRAAVTFCARLTPADAALCRELSRHAPAMLTALADGTAPSEICTNLKACHE